MDDHVTPLDPRTSMEHLDRERCLHLLEVHAHEVGRLAYVDRGVPTIVPVNYAMAGDRLVLRTAPGGKLDAAYRKARVAFEIDHIDLERAAGWSVVVHGWAETVTRTVAAAMFATTGLQPWVQLKPHWVVIHPEEITGRRVPDGLF